MDPISLIVGAVLAGTTGGLTQVVSDEVKRAYTALKSSLLSRFGHNRALEESLALAEAGSHSKLVQGTLAEVLAEERAAQDPDLLVLAQKVLTLAGPDSANRILASADAVVRQNRQRICGEQQGRAENVISAEGATVEGNEQSITTGDLTGEGPQR